MSVSSHGAAPDAGPAGETPWELTGSGGEPLLGVAHAPGGEGAAGRGASVILAHGFKGFLDYGLFPRLARTLAAAGHHVHRFNFSHSGMTRRTKRFERPELFERDTWNRQVADLAAVADGVRSGRLAGANRPLVLFGHSRGGAAVVLAAGRGAIESPDGIITAAAPADAVRLPAAERTRLLDEGFLPSPSSRTGQELRVGREWLEEILADPPGHDPCVQAGRIHCPMLVIHGEDDETVSAGDAERLAAAAGSRAPDRGRVRVVIVPGANHVFDAPNPLEDGVPAPPALERLLAECVAFVSEIAAGT